MSRSDHPRLRHGHTYCRGDWSAPPERQTKEAAIQEGLDDMYLYDEEGPHDQSSPDDPNPDPTAALGRCKFSWNPGVWPYVKRCDLDATQVVFSPGDDERLPFCDDHAAVVREYS